MRPRNPSAVISVFSIVLCVLVAHLLVAPTSAQTIAPPADKTVEIPQTG